MTKKPKPEPAWYWVTHYVNGGPAVITLRFQLKVDPYEFLDSMSDNYARDVYLKVGDGTQFGGVPTRNILHTELKPCLQHEIPRDA